MDAKDCNGGLPERVLGLRETYHRARDHYRAMTGRSLPALAALERLGRNLYVQQASHFDESEQARYADGVLVRMLGCLERRTPELEARDPPQAEHLSTYLRSRRDAHPLHGDLQDMAAYACYRALLRVDDAVLSTLLEVVSFVDRAPMEEYEAVGLALETVTEDPDGE